MKNVLRMHDVLEGQKFIPKIVSEEELEIHLILWNAQTKIHVKEVNLEEIL